MIVALLAACSSPKVMRGPIIEVTGAAQALTQLTRDPAGELEPCLSPDKKTLLFSQYVWSQGRQAEQILASVNPASGASRKLYTPKTSRAAFPTYAPDGSRVLYTTNTTGRWAIAQSLGRTPGATARIVVPGNVASDIQVGDVSPDGRKILFSALMNGVWKIAEVEFGSTNVTVLGEGLMPCYDPSGKTILFARTVSGWNHLFTMEAGTGAGLTQLTGSDRFYCIYPNWSPDGKAIVFASNQDAVDKSKSVRDFASNLYTIKVDGSDLVQLTTGAAQCTQPHWGEDGYIYFACCAAEPPQGRHYNYDLWRLRPVLN
jgi:TolB protein